MSKRQTLLALTTAALALPGLMPVQAAVAPEKSSLGYRYNNYQEDAIAPHKQSGNSESVERYDIEVHQLQLITPLTEKFALTLNGVADHLSGASPWLNNTQGSDGQPKATMSGASGIREERWETSAAGRYYLPEAAVGGFLRYSREKDYEGRTYGLDGELELNNKLTVLSAGFSVSNDSVEPTQLDDAQRILHASKKALSTSVGLSQVIDKVSVAQLGLSYSRAEGYLTDPYKVRDKRPDGRDQWSAAAGYRRFFAGLDGALHLNYRYYWDSWDIDSQTVETAWYQNLPEGDIRWQLVPSLRYYSQSQAEFYQPYYSGATTDYYSDDFRLSPYGAVSGGLKVIAGWHDWKFILGGERYVSGQQYAVDDVKTESPSLIQFTRWTAGFDYSW